MLVDATVLPVVNDQVTGLIALCDTSCAPLIATLYDELKARPVPETGVSVAVLDAVS